MGLIQTVTQWFQKNEAVLSANSPVQSEWYNSEILNGGQFFLKYTGTSNVGVNLHLSPADAHGNKGVDPADCYDVVQGVAAGANGGLGWFNPATPSSYDRPFKSFRVELTVSANITACYFAMCSNGVQ